MKRLRLNQDITSLSEFRAELKRCIEQVQHSKRPMVITQRGQSAAVVLDVEAYDDLMEELETLRDIHTATQQIKAGKGVPHDQARRELIAELEESSE